MRRITILNPRAANARCGVSIVEFVGCLAALGGGVVLGSMYLGVDVRAMAVGILEKADIDVPAVFNAESLAPTEETPAEQTDTGAGGEAVADIDPAGPTTDAAETADEQQLDGTSETTADAPEREPLTEAESLAATKACWAALNQCMKDESSNRSKSIRDPGNWQLFDYLIHRKQGHAKVVETLEELDRFGIDQRLSIHIQQVVAWHRAGESLFDRATHLLTDAPAGKLSGPFAQSWQSAATQHRMEEKLILNKHTAVAGYLEHTHKQSPEPTPGN